MTRTVSLRPLVASDLDALWAARVRSDAPWADTSDGARRKLQERIGRSGRLAGGELLLGSSPTASWRGDPGRQPEMGLPPGVFEIGIEVFDPAARGNGIGRLALARFVTLLFDEEHAHRIQLTTDVDNLRCGASPNTSVSRGKGRSAGSCRRRTGHATT